MSLTLRYDDRTRFFHWLTAGLILLMWALAQIIDLFGRDVAVAIRSTHIVVGIALIVIYAQRLIWRISHGATLPPASTGLQHVAAKATHYALYLLVAGVLLGGLAYEAVRADNIFYLGRLPSIAPGDRELRRTIGDLHGTGANLILILAGIHALAALYHHFIRKDGVLRRMLPV